MRHYRSVAVAWIVMSVAPYALSPHRALAQPANDVLAKIPELRDQLKLNGFDVLSGYFKTLDPVLMVCTGVIPSTWYNNVEPYMGVILDTSWQKSNPALPVTYWLRQDEALLVVGNTPPRMAYFSFQTFLFGRHNPATQRYDKRTGGFFRPYETLLSYVGDAVNSLTIRTAGPTPFDQPMALISTGNRQTQERIRAALISAGFGDDIINTETLPPSLLRFGYDTGDQFLFTVRMALPAEGAGALNAIQKRVEAGEVMQVFRVRPKVEIPSDPLPAPVLRPRGTGHTEMDLYPTMEKLRQAILADPRFAGYSAEELDTFLPDSSPEGYPAIQRDIAFLGPGRDGSAGYGRDANYWASSSWFKLSENDFAILYGVDHATTRKATYSSANVYLHETFTAGVASADSATFAANPGTASAYLPGEPGIEKFYVWKVARDCKGESACLEAKVDAAHSTACAPPMISSNASVRIAFRQYAEPATRVGPADAELLYDRVIVFRAK